MHIYNYRGGGVRVDQCSSCDHFFLDGGELSEILREWDEGLELSDQARGALLTHHASQAAATEGPDFGLLLWILVLVVWIALEAVGLFTRQGMSSPVFFVGLLFLLGMVGVGVWRRIRAQRHTAHELHLARVRELGGIDQPEAKEREFSAKILGKGEEKPQHPLATPEPLRSEAASYRQAAPETRLKAEAGGSPAFPKSSSRK